MCRLFGYGATKDKFAQLRLATCSIIKEQQTENYNKTNEAINNGLSVPIFICMQIEEFSHLTGKLVFGILLVILIYYEIFLCRLEESVLTKWLQNISFARKTLGWQKKRAKNPV